MKATQKALLVTTGPDGTRGLDVLNEHLQKGWRLSQAAPMGGAGGGDAPAFAALVVVERSGDEAESVLEQIEEELEETLDGDGASVELAEPQVGRSLEED